MNANCRRNTIIVKVRRSDRLIDMTRFLLENPHQIISLTFFSKRYESAKSSISEDLAIIRRTFQQRGTGILETIPGAAGGVCYLPMITRQEASDAIAILGKKLSETTRLLPGGYVYLSDLLGEPKVLREVGRMIATQYLDEKVDAVMTVATKGIPLAQSVANFLNVPFVIVRRDSKITEGATVSVNYVSGSSQRVEKMELSKRSLSQGARVVIVDDFMKGGGTVNGMQSLLKEFDAVPVGVSVFAESAFDGQRMVADYVSLLKVDEVNLGNKTIQVSPGNYLDQKLSSWD